MRTIKFRAWDNSDKANHYMLGPYDLTDSIFNHKDIRSLPLMQFTGLTDKNGKEIYEGDVVRILYTDWGSKLESDTRTLEQYLIDIASVGSIVFNENSWEVYFGLDKYGFDSYSNINPGKHGYIEIIGNIHETPELL